jgi:hypothetical protein
MVSKSILSMLELTDIDEYFEYIMERFEDGRGLEAKGLFSQLSEDSGNRKGQRTKFFDWVETTYYYDADSINEMSTEMTNIYNFFTGKNQI